MSSRKKAVITVCVCLYTGDGTPKGQMCRITPAYLQHAPYVVNAHHTHALCVPVVVNQPYSLTCSYVCVLHMHKI